MLVADILFINHPLENCTIIEETVGCYRPTIVLESGQWTLQKIAIGRPTTSGIIL